MITNVIMISLYFTFCSNNPSRIFVLFFSVHYHYFYLTRFLFFLNYYTCHCLVWFYSSILKNPFFILFLWHSFLKANFDDADHSLKFWVTFISKQRPLMWLHLFLWLYPSLTSPILLLSFQFLENSLILVPPQWLCS